MVAAADLPSGRLAFLFSDIEGSTRLLTDLGDRFADLLVDHQRLVRSSLAAHRGIEISTEGNSFFAVFRSALDAVAAAAAAPAWVRRHTPGRPATISVSAWASTSGRRSSWATTTSASTSTGRRGSPTPRTVGRSCVSDAAAVDVAGGLPSGLALLDLGRHRLRDIGVEHLWRLEIEGLVSRATPLRSLEAHPTNLPVEIRAHRGSRGRTLELRRLITEGQLVTVTGPGGIGKATSPSMRRERSWPEYPRRRLLPRPRADRRARGRRDRACRDPGCPPAAGR